MKRILLLLTILSLSSTVSAFDGERKGFVFGGGIGLFSLPENKGESKIVTFNLVLGLGLSEQNLIVLNGAEGDPRTVGDFSGGTHTVMDKSFYLISWYHFFKPSKESMFAGIGIGKYNNSFMTDAIWESPNSIKLSFGYGYNHFIFEAYLLSIRESNCFKRGQSSNNLGFMVGALAF